MLDNRVYDVLKWVALVALPALSAFVACFLSMWGLVDESTATAIVGTISAFATFLGALLGVSSVKYNKNQQADAEKTENE